MSAQLNIGKVHATAKGRPGKAGPAAVVISASVSATGVKKESQDKK